MVKKKTEIEAPANAALQASITPVGIEFGMNKLRLGENYCRIYGIFMLPTEVEYGWLAKLTNIPGTIVTINYEPRNNAEAINDLSRKIRMFRGQAASTKDPKERMRYEKAALSQETALQRMDSGGFYLGRNSNDGLILLDPWIRNRQRPNSNMTIVGGSGSGKSTAIKHIIASEYARGTKIIVIDPEGEYKDMCLNPLFEGSWIDVAGGDAAG